MYNQRTSGWLNRIIDLEEIMLNWLRLGTRLKTPLALSACTIGLLAGVGAPLDAAVVVTAITPSIASPQVIGTSVSFTATATDTGAGPLTFQWNVTTPAGVTTMVDDFNVGTLSSGVWTSQPFVWFPSSCAGVAQPDGIVAYTCQPAGGKFTIQAVAKDFTANLSSSLTTTYQITPLVTGTKPVVVTTPNPLVALFSSPGCATGSQMRVVFQEKSQATPATVTNYLSCRGTSSTMTFEIAGMYPTTEYIMYSQTLTKGTTTNGTKVAYTTGTIPTSVPIPSFTINVAAGSGTDTGQRLLLYNPHQFGSGPIYANTATDLSGKVMWYYAPSLQNVIIGRPLLNGTMLVIQNGTAWDTSPKFQLLTQIDLAGNILRETNAGIIAEELTAMGDPDTALCSTIAKPATVGSACLDQFHHDAIQTLPDGNTMVLANIEKIFPPGTQGDTSGLPVDVLGDILIILNSSWQPIWYFDTFDPAGGGNGYPQMPVTREAVLNETCGENQDGCPPMYLLGTGIAPLGKNWIHANSLYYWPEDQLGKKGQIIWSSRNQDWVFKVDYQNGTGTNQIDWVMGNGSADFQFQNIDNDPWPWFSGQHDVSIQSNTATGAISCFDNGNTRVSAPPLGLGSDCGDDCYSRGMVLNSTRRPTP
jgi:arylsulfate sulfotransferase